MHAHVFYLLGNLTSDRLLSTLQTIIQLFHSLFQSLVMFVHTFQLLDVLLFFSSCCICDINLEENYANLNAINNTLDVNQPCRQSHS